MTERPTGSPTGDEPVPPTPPTDTAPTAAQPPVPSEQQPAWAAASATPPPGGPPPPRPPGRARRTWDEATSSTGGRVALGAVAVLATLLVVAVIGLGAALVGGHGRGEDARGRTAFGRDDDRPGMQRGGPMTGQGRDGRPGRDGRQGADGPQGQGRQDQGQQGGTGRLPGQGQGRGAMTGGMAGMDDVLHGEFTTAATGTPVVMVVQVGEVTAYTAGKSIAVRSADGFAATYDLSAGYASTRIGLPLQVGAQVRVVAAKEGLAATRLNVLG
ncbi:hypothetical protein [Phycicoccus avicenniae]|uniref:hypothetical protein n=1 Tax=Phycicoccus avicenniae TaxID=2828860 RepID=UPI003D2C8537